MITPNASRADAPHLGTFGIRGGGAGRINQCTLSISTLFDHMHMIRRLREEGDDSDLPIRELIVREDGETMVTKQYVVEFGHREGRAAELAVQGRGVCIYAPER